MFGSVGGSGFDSDCQQAGASRAEQFWCGFLCRSCHSSPSWSGATVASPALGTTRVFGSGMMPPEGAVTSSSGLGCLEVCIISSTASNKFTNGRRMALRNQTWNILQASLFKLQTAT